MRSTNGRRARGAFAAGCAVLPVLVACTTNNSSPVQAAETTQAGASAPATAPTTTANGTQAATPTASPTATPTPTPTPTPTSTPPRTGPQLPGGGYTIFPRYRVIAYYGNGQSRSMGVLGHFPSETAAGKVAAVAKQWATSKRPTLAAMELIVTIADGSAGGDGNFSHDTSDAVIDRYVATVRKHHQLLVLDIQPGRQDFLTVVKRYEKYLIQPDIGIALDPEWRMGAHDVPGRVIGHVTAAEINRVSAYVDELARKHNLPQKILMLHNFTSHMIVHPEAVLPRDGLAMVWHVDGFGAWSDKVKVFARLHQQRPFFNGFKLFYSLDRPLATPRRVLALSPSPDFISFQ